MGTKILILLALPNRKLLSLKIQTYINKKGV